MTKDYASLSAEDLLTELEHAGRAPALDLIRECLERPEELTPTLLTWLEEGSEPTWDDENPHWYKEVHAGLLLIAYREPAALPILADIFRDEERENLIEWFQTELPAYGPDIIDWAIDLLNDESTYEYPRSAATEILTTVGVHHPSERERILEALRTHLPPLKDDGTPDLLPDEYDPIWTWVVLALTKLRDTETQPQVTALFEAECIDGFVIGLDDYLAYFELDTPAPDAPSSFDILKTYEWLHRQAEREAEFAAGAEQRRAEAQRRAERAAEEIRPASTSTDQPADQPTFQEPEKLEPYVRSEPKVGRNDPCPCGSSECFTRTLRRTQSSIQDLGMSFSGSTKGLRTTVAGRSPTSGMLTVNSVPRSAYATGTVV